jgi:hypothetical protein
VSRRRRENRRTGHSLKHELVDSVTGEAVNASDKARGYEIGENEFLFVEDQDLARARSERPPPGCSRCPDETAQPHRSWHRLLPFEHSVFDSRRTVFRSFVRSHQLPLFRPCRSTTELRRARLPEFAGPAFGKSYSTPTGCESPTRPAIAPIGPHLDLAFKSRRCSLVSIFRRFRHARCPEQLKRVVDEAAEKLGGFIATGPTSDDL